MPSKYFSILVLFEVALTLTVATAVQAQPMDEVALDDLSAFHAPDGWSIAGDAGALWHSPDLETEPGQGVLVREVDGGQLVTAWEHGDLILELDYLLPKGAASGIFLQGRYEVQLADSWGVEHPRYADAAGVSPVEDGSGMSQGHPPRTNASRAPGLWQHLRIVFEAPRFDADGQKTADARIVRVVHNGVTVQESVRLSGPTRGAPFADERPAGPLVVEGGPGAIALRNIRYRHYEPIEPVTLSDVRYTLYRGEFGSLEEMSAAAPAESGEAFGYVWDLFGRTADRFGPAWEGQIHIPRTGDYTFAMRFNWIDEIPYEEDAVPGLGQFTVGGEVVVDHTGDDSTAFGTVHLREGSYPFMMRYFKNRRLWRPIVWLRVEGPGMPMQHLNAYRTLPEPETSYPMVPVDVGREPYVLRSFAEYDSTKKTNVVSVGDPSGTHYALDLNAGSLLTAWKGAFVDVGSMWTGRGELQYAVPLGQRIDLSDKPTVAMLPNADAPWPGAEAAGLRFEGYTLDAGGRPTFRYASGEVELRETLRPEEEGRVLRRSLVFSSMSKPENLWVRVAEGNRIHEHDAGVYSVDGTYFLDMGTGSDAFIRRSNGRDELLLPIRFTVDEAVLEYSIIW